MYVQRRVHNFLEIENQYYNGEWETSIVEPEVSYFGLKVIPYFMIGLI